LPSYALGTRSRSSSPLTPSRSQLELDVPGIGKEEGGILVGDGAGAGDKGVLCTWCVLEVVEEGSPDPVGGPEGCEVLSGCGHGGRVKSSEVVCARFECSRQACQHALRRQTAKQPSSRLVPSTSFHYGTTTALLRPPSTPRHCSLDFNARYWVTHLQLTMRPVSSLPLLFLLSAFVSGFSALDRPRAAFLEDVLGGDQTHCKVSNDVLSRD
jgi:hypothetical protein